jgi:sigma-E factor negative regulatory protein RseC
MAFEKGVVVKLAANRKDTAWIKTIQPDACKACASRKNCASAGGSTQTVEAINKAGAQVGDIIQVYMDTTALLKAAFLLYVFPILCMLAGGGAGHLLSILLKGDAPLLSMGTAIGCFILAMALVRARGARMALNIDYRPKITRILGHQKGTSAPIEPPGDCTAKVAPTT